LVRLLIIYVSMGIKNFNYWVSFLSHLTSVAPDSTSHGVFGEFILKVTKAGFSRAGSGKLSFGRCFDGAVTLPDHLRLPTVRHRLPVNWGR